MKVNERGLLRAFGRAVGMLALGVAATVIPVSLLLRRELRSASDDVKHTGWPLQILQVIFQRYIRPWIEVGGLENLPQGSYILAANHGLKSGADGFILGHLIATEAGRIPRIVMTAEGRSSGVTVERWVLHHYGIALLVPDERLPLEKRRIGLTDTIAAYLRAAANHSVIIFPAGRAVPDYSAQFDRWSTGVIVSSEKAACPIVPVAISGLPFDTTPETLLREAIVSADQGIQSTRFRIRVRIGKAIVPEGEPHEALEGLRKEIAALLGEPEAPPANAL